MTEKVIECVRRHPCLYNTNNNSYKNIAMKSKLWKVIGKEINETGEVARKKWKSLRDNYMRYKKEVAGTTRQGTKKFTKWPWAAQLQFLDITLTDRERSTNTRQPKSETPLPDTYPSETQSPEPPQSETHLLETLQPPPDTPSLHSVGRTRVKQFKNTDCDMDNIINYLQNKKIQDYDAIDHLFQSYAKTFKSFSKQKQIKAKVEMAKLFANIETEEMQKSLY